MASEPQRQRAHQLKLFLGPEGQDGYWWPGDSGPTLSQFYFGFAEPEVLIHAKPRNIDAYREGIKRWIEITGDPLLSQIDQTTCALFVTELSRRPGRRGAKRCSPNTVRKTCRHVQRILDLAGPPSRDNRLGQDLYGEEEIPGSNGRPPRFKARAIPYLQQPARRRKAAEDLFTIDELDRWLAVFPRAVRPQIPAIRPGTWWTSLVLWLYNTGSRIGTALELRWDWIRGPWIHVPADSVKGHDNRRIWLSRHAHAALEQMRPSAPHCGGRVYVWPHCRRYLDTRRERLLELADIDPAGHGFHALKKSLTTHLMGIDSGIAQMVAGHGDLKTTVDHYTHPELARMAEIMDEVPQPDASRMDPQRRLF